MEIFPTGDINSDGNVTAYDAFLILQHIIGSKELSTIEQEKADVTGDNTVSALDAVLILQYAVGLITRFPIQPEAPIFTVKNENQMLTKILSKFEYVSLTMEQKHVLEQLKQLIHQQLRPSHTALLPNYPNPFNPETWFPYQLAQDANVTISIYNINGQLVRTLRLGNQSADIYVMKGKAAYWDGRDSLGQKVASGVYFYTLQVGKFNATRRMLILK